MNTDIEDFVKSKNKLSEQDYNNFDPNKYDINTCKQIILEMLAWIDDNNNLIQTKTNKEFKSLFDKQLNHKIRKSKLSLRKSILLYILNNYIDNDQIDNKYDKYLDLLNYLLIKKHTRSESGVTVITVVTAPFPNGQKFSCKHNCYYCPNEPAHAGNNWQAQPRSYLYKEPAVLRANQHDFKAIGQMFNRFDTYKSNGHISKKTKYPDKIEIIIEGGTFTEYPEEYLEDYLRDLFYAANIYPEFVEKYSNYNEFDNSGLDISLLESIRAPNSVEFEAQLNETSDIHIIGICIETRPDALNDEWLQLFRKWGVTRIQLGAQHVKNDILKKINRGHTVEQLIEAMQYLKDNCFKIDIHIMPDLPGSTPEIDKNMFDYVYSQICPDQMKVYPCEVVPWTVIEKWYKNGKYIPYFEKNPNDLIDVVRYSMETCPNWVRLPRVIRDIPASYIECGNTIANLRQNIDNQLDSEGITSNDIRFREISRERNEKYFDLPAKYRVYPYEANDGIEYFITYESYDSKAIFGFLRLRIVNPQKNYTIFNILKNRGLIRELHVYGNTNGVGVYSLKSCQHKGIGRNLLKIAEKKTRQHGINGIVVISGEGVKGYYRKYNYFEKDSFMIKDFNLIHTYFDKIVYLLITYLSCLISLIYPVSINL